MDILPQLILNSIIASAIYMMVALGFNLIFGTVKFFDLGYGALTTVGGYSVFFLYKKLGIDLKGYYAVRAWPYRFIYRIEKEIVTVTVVAIGHRKDVYKKM